MIDRFQWLALLALLFLHLQICNAAESTVSGRVHFQQFYNQLRPMMHKLLDENCSALHNRYLHDPTFKSDNYLECKGCAAAPLTGCLLSAFHEVDKINMASAAVLLGMVPATLSLAGSSTAETGLLSMRRPFLAFLVGSGAPAVSPIRTFNYGNPEELIQMRTKPLSHPRLTSRWNMVILVLEYLFALLAVGDLIWVSYELCVQSVCTFALDTAYLPALWAFLAAAVHVFGAAAVIFRVRLQVLDRATGMQKKRSLRERVHDEFTLSKEQEPAVLTLKSEDGYFLFLSWFCSTGTVVHIIFGTLVFSSILFITTRDAVMVVLQFLGSTTVCRAVLMYELSGMRQVVQVPEANSHLKCSSHGARDPWRSTSPFGRRARTEYVPLVDHALITPKSTW